MNTLKAKLTLILLFTVLFSSAQSKTDSLIPQLKLVKQYPNPVITVRSKGAEGIRWGFEGGRVVKVGKTYHLFTSEMIDNPIWTKMKLGQKSLFYSFRVKDSECVFI